MNAILLMTLALNTAAEDSTAEKKSVKPLIATANQLVLKVVNREATADAIVGLAEESGGYFSARFDDSVTLKVPSAKAPGLLAFIEKQGVVVQRNYQADDVAFSLEEMRTRLRSREQVLARYFAVLEGAKVDAVVNVEREMTRQVQQIEELAGRLKLLEHRLAFTKIQVDFQFQDRRPPLKTGNSNFEWLNTVNLADLIGGFS
ncbi:MAG: DUF4349 domain-containing protein [Myxococcota bacterium]